jgi:hypothetical protein
MLAIGVTVVELPIGTIVLGIGEIVDKFDAPSGAGGLTPALPISKEPNGIPVRGAPPGATGDVVGVDDAVMLLEPEPHIPDIPAVSVIPDVVDVPDVAAIDDDVDIPEVAAVAGDVVPNAIPPPS